MFAADEIESPSSKNRPPPCIAFLVDTSATPLHLDSQKVFGTHTVDTLTTADIHSNSYIQEKIEEYIGQVKLAIIKILLYFQYYVDKKFQWGYQFYTSDTRTLLLSSNKNKFFKLNQDSIDVFIDNFKKLILKNVQEKYLKNKGKDTSSFNCLNNLVITLRECLASFNWNYSRDVGFLSPMKKKKKSIVLHHYLFLVTPLPDSYHSLVKFIENQRVYQIYLQQRLENGERDEEEDPTVLKENMDVLLDKFQNDFIKKALWTAYLQNKIGISWIDTNLKYKEDQVADLEILSKTHYIEEKYIKESIETLLNIYGGNVINLYDISRDSQLLPFSSYISNYRTKSINMATGELLISHGRDRREKMILENEEKKMKKALWSGYLTHTKGRNKTTICKMDIIPMLREQKQALFKSMDGFKKNSDHEYLSKISRGIPPFSLKRKSISIVSLIDTNIIDSAWLDGQEYFCQLSHDMEEMDELLNSLFFFKTMTMLKLGVIVEVYLNMRIKNSSDDDNEMDGLSLLSKEDPDELIDYESKKHYGVLIPISECLGFIRIINETATETIQSYIKSSKKRTSPKQENFLSKLTEEDLYELLSIGIKNKPSENDKINHHEFSMNYLERWYKSILNNFDSSEVKKIELTELMLLSPNSENVLPKEKKNVSKKRSKKSTKRNQYQLFTEDAIIELYQKREKEKALQEQQNAENLSNNSENSDNSDKEKQEKKKKKTVKEIIQNLKSFVFDILYYEKNTIEDFGRTINTIHSKLYSKKEEKNDSDHSTDSSSSESLDFDENNDENSQEEMKKLYLSTLSSSIVMTPEQIDHKYKNFVNYINALSTLPSPTNSNENTNENDSDPNQDSHQPSHTINKSDFFEEGIIKEEEEQQIQLWKMQNEKEMEKIEEKVTRMKIEEAQIQVIILLEYLRLYKKEKISFPEILLDSENQLANLHHRKKEFKKPRKKSDTQIIRSILETLMDKLCIWMTLDQFPTFDSVNTLDNELSDDKITDFVNRILKDLFNKDLPKIIKHLYTKVSGGLEDEDPKSNLLSPKFKEKMLKSREKYKIQKPQKVQSISEKLREESQSLSTNKMTGKSSFDRLFKDREVVIVKKESKHKKKAKKSVVIKEPKEKMKSPKKLLLLDEDEDEEVKMVLKPRKSMNPMSILSNLMLTPRKKRNRNELLKNITKSPYKMSNWITNDGLPQPKKPNSSSEFIVFAPKTPSKKNKKSRNNVYFVGNENGKPLETTDKNTRDNMEFKVCQTPMVPKRSKSMVEDRKVFPLVRSQSLLEELNSIAAADNKENASINANRKDSTGNQNNSDGNHEDTSMDSAKLEIKNLFEASFSKSNVLSRSQSFNEGIQIKEKVKEKETNFSFSIKSLYDSYLNNNSSHSSSGSQDNDRFNIFSYNSIHLHNGDGDSPDSNDSITFRKLLPKDINNPSDGSNNDKTPSVSDHGNNDDNSPTSAKGMNDLEQLKHQYSQQTASENRRISFSPSPSPTPMSYSREISLSPTFNKVNRNSSFTLGLDAHTSFLDFSNTKDQEEDTIFPPGSHTITTTPKVDRRSSFINFNPRTFDLSSESGSSGGGQSPTPAAPTNDSAIFQKPWSRRQALTESPTRVTEEEEENEEIMRTPSKRKLKQTLPMFTFTSPSVKRKNRPFDDDDFPQTRVSPPPSSTTDPSHSKTGEEDPSHYLKVPILSTPKKRRINFLKVSDTKPPTYDPKYLAPTTTYSSNTHSDTLSQDTMESPGHRQNQNLDLVMTTPSKKYNIFTVAPTPTKYTSLFD